MIAKRAKLEFKRALLEANNFSINENATILFIE
jgi:hypothetical protein